MSIAEFLRDRIHDSGVSIKRLSDVSGVRYGTLQAFMKGGTSFSMDNIEKLAGVLHLSMIQVETPEIVRLTKGRRGSKISSVTDEKTEQEVK